MKSLKVKEQTTEISVCAIPTTQDQAEYPQVR
jgi:hypothetical protein